MQQRRTGTQSIAHLVELYLLRCRVEGKAECTVHAYGWTLGRFLRDLVERGTPPAASSITQEHVYRYLGTFAHLSLETRHRYFREVRCFFNWLMATAHLDESPFRYMKNVRLPKKIVRPYNTEEVLQLVAACAVSPVGLRDRAILFVLLDTGVRISELAQLDLEDVELDLMRLRVLHGKGNKQRVVPFSEACR